MHAFIETDVLLPDPTTEEVALARWALAEMDIALRHGVALAGDGWAAGDCGCLVTTALRRVAPDLDVEQPTGMLYDELAGVAATRGMEWAPLAWFGTGFQVHLAGFDIAATGLVPCGEPASARWMGKASRFQLMGSRAMRAWLLAGGEVVVNGVRTRVASAS